MTVNISGLGIAQKAPKYPVCNPSSLLQKEGYEDFQPVL